MRSFWALVEGKRGGGPRALPTKVSKRQIPGLSSAPRRFEARYLWVKVEIHTPYFFFGKNVLFIGLTRDCAEEEVGSCRYPVAVFILPILPLNVQASSRLGRVRGVFRSFH